MKVKDCLWIWGHPTNSLKGCAGLTATSLVTPVAGMKELGATGIFYVPMGHFCDRPACNAEMWNVPRVGWSIESKKNVTDLIAQKKEWPNLRIGVFDDFFSEANGRRNYTKYTPEKMLWLKKKMHEAGLEMWVVFYTMQIGLDYWKTYLPLFDGVTFWFWDEPSNREFDEKCRWFFEQTEGQKRMIGCYLYNFGGEKEATAASVRYQLDRDLSFMKEGKIQGIVLHTNAVGGMGFDAYEEAKRWVAEHGKETV